MSAFIAIILNFFPPGAGFGLIYVGGSRMLLILFFVWIVELWLSSKIVVGLVCALTVFFSIVKIMQGYAREDDEPAVSVKPAQVSSNEEPSDGEHIKYALKSFEGKLAEADRRLREERTESGAAKSEQELISKLAGAATTSHTLGDGSPESRAAAADLLNVFQSAANLNTPKPEDSVPSSAPLDFSPPHAVPEPSSLLPPSPTVCKNCGAEKGDFNFCTKCGLSFDM